MAIVGLMMFLFAVASSIFVFFASVGAILIGLLIYGFKDYRDYRNQDKDES